MAAIIDGKAIAKRVRTEVLARAQAFEKRTGRKPGLEVVLVGDDPASQVYVRNKERASIETGMRGAVHRVPADASQGRVVELVQRLNADPAVDGILVQLPLPKQIDPDAVIACIEPAKDVDGLTPINAGLLVLGRVLMSWVDPMGRTQAGRVLSQLTEPFLAPIRSVLPRTGMFDLAPLVLLLVLGVLLRLLV